MKTFAFILMLMGRFTFAAEFSVKPDETGAGIRQARGEHVVLYGAKDTNGLLLITIGGTGSKPRDLIALGETALSKGYHVLGIDYPNKVITTACRENKDRACFDKFRREIDLGEAVSDLVDVDIANSLVNRIEKLLAYLVKEKKPGAWAQFLGPDGKPLWEKIAIAGHSQGAGHAAFLGKQFSLERVLCLAGPQDVDSRGTSAWLTAKGKTPGARYTALLHRSDSFGTDNQLKAMRALVGTPEPATAEVATEPPASGKYVQVLISKRAVTDAHMSVIDKENKDLWMYLLTPPKPVRVARGS